MVVVDLKLKCRRGVSRQGALDWLKDNPSVEDAKAFIQNYPDALMGIYDFKGRMLLHYAILYRVSEEVILLLLEACPQAAAKEDKDGRLPLHYAINEVDGDGDKMCSEEVIKALLNACPGAASERHPKTGNLPLHAAVKKKASEGMILSLLNAYPQAAFVAMKDGRLLVEIFLERKASDSCPWSDDLMREICKVRVRVDGLLPLGVVLTKRSSDDIVLAVLEAYPEAAGKRFSTNCDECILPLHIAYEDEHSEPVKDALRRAYPDAEKENPFETTHQLHKFLENVIFDELNFDSDGSGDVDVRNLIEKYPEAARKRGRDGRLPLHIAIYRMAPWYITDQLFEAYPQAGEEKMKNGRLPIDIEVFANHDYVSSAEYVHVKEDLKWLRNYPSVGDAKAFIENYPDALMGIERVFGRRVPLHYAIRYRVSDEVILLLLKACPQAAAAKEDLRSPYNVLHLAIDGEDRDKMCSEKVIKALLNANPGAASERNPRTGNLPLHDAINKNASGGIILSLLNAYPQAGKVRIDGLLPLGVVLTNKRSSDDTVLAVLKADPEAARKQFSTKFDECILPLHIASEDKHSEKVQKALLDAYPGAAEKENPFETTYLLHKFLENEPLNSVGAINSVKNLIKTYPEAAGKRGRDGRLPLHIAIDRIAHWDVTTQLFNEYPQAGKEKMKDGRLPIQVFVEQKETKDWPQYILTNMATFLLENDMPVSYEEDGTPVEHSGSWHACISYSTKTATDAVRRVLLDSEKKDDYREYGGDFGKHIHALADARDAKGRTALGLAAEESREVINEYLLFCGRYKLQIGPPEHRTATSVVLRAQDLGEQVDYGVIFDQADKDGNKKLDKEELNAIAGSIGLDPGLFLKGSEESDESISKGEFVAICKRQLGAGPREVVIKLMKNKDQWERECNARKKNKLDPNYVVSALPNIPSEDAIADAVRDGEGGLDIIREKYLNGIEVGEHAFAMDAGDRNLLQMFYQEQPNIDAVRHILRKVFEAVKHMHEKKLMHGDIKMLNVVRFRIDNGLRLIDLDASAAIMPVGEVDEKKTFAGAKFSSAILPPEMIERIEKDQVDDFDAYWVGEDDALVKKVAPKPYKEQGTVKAHYVVKSFRTGLDGKPVYDGLPYTLVEAKESIDLWSLGVLAFTLFTGEMLIPSTRDDDCASGAAMHLLHSWGTQPEVLSEVFNKIQDKAACDLVWKLLQREPAKRKTVDHFLEKHPFFNPKMEDQFIYESLQDIKNRLEMLNANMLEVKKLSIESMEELFHTRLVLHSTRHVLLKGIFEATEVYTPTTFIILNNKLPPAAEPSGEQVDKILGIVTAEDGSGVSVKTKGASVTFSADGANIDLEGDLNDYYERVQDGITWAERLRKIGTNFAAGEVGKAFDIIKEGIKDLIVGNEMYLYLVDELTGKPVEAKGWPLTITTPSETVPRLIPLMQVGMRVISICNGASGLAKVFGIPAPRVPKEWSKGARDSVELLKQESSVQEFGVVHAQVKGETQENTSVRGASLREFQDFMNKNDPGLKEGKNGNFAGLQRIGDPEEGTALWTTLTDQSAIESALKERKKQREEEERKQDLNRRQEEMAMEEEGTQEETNEETSGTEEVHSLTDGNVLAASEEIDELEATAVAKEVASTPATGSVCCTIM